VVPQCLKCSLKTCKELLCHLLLEESCLHRPQRASSSPNHSFVHLLHLPAFARPPMSALSDGLAFREQPLEEHLQHSEHTFSPRLLSTGPSCLLSSFTNRPPTALPSPVPMFPDCLIYNITQVTSENSFKCICSGKLMASATSQLWRITIQAIFGHINHTRKQKFACKTTSFAFTVLGKIPFVWIRRK